MRRINYKTQKTNYYQKIKEPDGSFYFCLFIDSIAHNINPKTKEVCIAIIKTKIDTIITPLYYML